jgi:5-methylcytosine-specific restriction endonuclease McrA
MSGSRRTSPLPRDRPRIRRQVLRRDRHVCQIQGPNCSYVATEVDHVGSPEDHRPESLQSAYRTCHGEKTKQQAAAGRSAQFAAWLAARSRPTEVHPGRVEPR